MCCRYGQPKLWTRDNATGCWNIQSAVADASIQQQLDAPPRAETADASCNADVDAQEDAGVAATDAAQASVEADTSSAVPLDWQLQQSLVLVTVEIPHVGLLDGTHAKSFTGQPHILEQWQPMDWQRPTCEV